MTASSPWRVPSTWPRTSPRAPARTRRTTRDASRPSSATWRASLLPAPEGRTFPAGEKDGEWATRLALSEWLENLPAPFRVVSAFQLNLDEGLACVDVAVPSPSCLALVAPDDEARQAEEARRYAWRLALLVARGAFAASSRIQRVGVNCVSHGAHETLLSLLVGRGELDGLLADAAAADAEPVPARNCHLDVAGDGRMLPVDALLARSDERLNPASRWDAVELDPMDASAAVRGPVTPRASRTWASMRTPAAWPHGTSWQAHSAPRRPTRWPGSWRPETPARTRRCARPAPARARPSLTAPWTPRTTRRWPLPSCLAARSTRPSGRRSTLPARTPAPRT